jgi:hypothetical protein
MTRHRTESISPGRAILIASLCLTGTLGCSLSRLLAESLVLAAGPGQAAPKNPALATRTPWPTFTPTDVPSVTPATTPSPMPTLTPVPTPAPAGGAAPAVSLLPGADTPESAPVEADTPEPALAEASNSELVPTQAGPSEPTPAEAGTPELAPTETGTPEVALGAQPPVEINTPTPKPKPKPTPTAARRPAVKAAAVLPTETPTPTITPTPAPKFAYDVVEVYSASTTNAFLTGYIMIVNADDIPIGGVKAVGNFDPGGPHYESPLSKWFFEGYSAPGPVLKTSSVKFEPPGGIQKGTWLIHLESEQGARLSDDVTIVTDPAEPEWFFIAFKQPGPRSTPMPTSKVEPTGTPGTPPAEGSATATPSAQPPSGTATRSSTWRWPY